MEHPGAAVSFVPGDLCVVEEADLLDTSLSIIVLDVQLKVVTNETEHRLDGCRLLDDLIMVAVEQVLLTLKSPEDLDDPGLLGEGEVTEMVDGVGRLDPSVPALDHLLVHLLLRGEGAVGVLDDVGVAEVRV